MSESAAIEAGKGDDASRVKAAADSPARSQRVEDVLRGRLLSLDAVRGYSMFLLIAMIPVSQALEPFSNSRLARTIMTHLGHSDWHGVTYIDTGLPAFIVAVGASIALSLHRRRQRGDSKLRLYARLGRRTLLLFLLGVIYNGGFQEPWPDVRIAGVLQRIAVCYFFAAFFYLNLRVRGQLILLVAILLAYWAILAWIPVPGYGAGDLSREGNLVAYVDRMYLPGRGLFGDWDPEGLLTTIPALATCLIGTLIGEILLAEKIQTQDKTLIMLAAGSVSMTLGVLWAQWLPLNKYMWTSSFTLFCGGSAFFHMAVFYQIVDVWKRNWFFPFVVIGLNSLLAYFFQKFIPFDALAAATFGGVARAVGDWGPLLLAGIQIVLVWLLLYGLYRRNLLMKV